MSSSEEAASKNKLRVPLILGTSSFGPPDSMGARLHTLPECQEALNVFLSFCSEFSPSGSGGDCLLDTARIYSDGYSEEFLGKLDVRMGMGEARICTKVHPAGFGRGSGSGSLTPSAIRASITKSLEALNGKKIKTFYLHAPDRGTPLEETLSGINELYLEGLFEEFGLSNYASFEVTRIYTICAERGYIRPSIYQRPYNILHRGVEEELLPCLRTFGIRFAVWSPLAGGLLSGNLRQPAPSASESTEAGGRWDPNTPGRRVMRNMFLSGTEWEAWSFLSGIIKQHDLTPSEVALRWLQHHSALTSSDYVIIGASKISHVRSNYRDLPRSDLYTIGFHLRLSYLVPFLLSASDPSLSRNSDEVSRPDNTGQQNFPIGMPLLH